MAKLSVSIVLAVVLASCALAEYEDDQCRGPPSCKPSPELKESFPFKAIRPEVPNGQYLKEHCSELISLLECVANHNRSCNMIHEDMIPIRNFDSNLLLLRDLCDEDSLTRKRYEHIADCFNDNINEFLEVTQEFMTNMRRFIEIVDKEIEERNQELEYQEVEDLRLCLVITYLRELDKESVTRICSADDADFSAELFSRFLKPMDVLCPPNDENVQHYLRRLEEFRSEEQSLENVVLDLLGN